MPKLGGNKNKTNEEYRGWRFGGADAEPAGSNRISTAIMEAVVLELETLIDRALAPKPIPKGKFSERADALAKGDFRDLADRELDRPSV